MKTKTKAKTPTRTWTRRPTVTKKCQKCARKRPHGTFLIRATDTTRTNSRCVDCERARQAANRAAKLAPKAKGKPRLRVRTTAKASA